MEKIKQVAEQAALTVLMEDMVTIPTIDIAFGAKGEEPHYFITVPTAFLEEVYTIGVMDGAKMNTENG